MPTKNAALIKNVSPHPAMPAPMLASAPNFQQLGQMTPLPVEETVNYGADMPSSSRRMQTVDEQLADGEDMTASLLNKKMDKLKNISQAKKINL